MPNLIVLCRGKLAEVIGHDVADGGQKGVSLLCQGGDIQLTRGNCSGFANRD